MGESSKLKDITGERFGRLVVKVYLGAQRWQCVCDCGRTHDVAATNLTRGMVRSCGCLRKGSRTLDRAGRRYGRLLVLRQTESGSGYRVRWLCRCDCGNEVDVAANNLGRGVRSCGCLQSECSSRRASQRYRGTFIQVAMNRIIDQYKRNAMVKKRPFDLTTAEVAVIFDSKCHYCGTAPSNRAKIPCRTELFVYNGIDRIDNDTGYIAGNVVPCCKMCNIMKGSMPYSEFTEWLNAVARFRSANCCA